MVPLTENRTASVLCNISSLPGPYGVGCFGEEARAFIDLLHEMNFRWWQVLPFNPLDSMNSPYTSPSAFAGNLLYIDPRDLLRRGLVTPEEEAANRWDGSPYTAAYDFAENRLLPREQRTAGGGPRLCGQNRMAARLCPVYGGEGGKR